MPLFIKENWKRKKVVIQDEDSTSLLTIDRAKYEDPNVMVDTTKEEIQMEIKEAETLYITTNKDTLQFKVGERGPELTIHRDYLEEVIAVATLPPFTVELLSPPASGDVSIGVYWEE